MQIGLFGKGEFRLLRRGQTAFPASGGFRLLLTENNLYYIVALLWAACLWPPQWDFFILGVLLKDSYCILQHLGDHCP